MIELTPERITGLRELCKRIKEYPEMIVIVLDALPDALDEIERLQRIIDEFDDMERL